MPMMAQVQLSPSPQATVKQESRNLDGARLAVARVIRGQDLVWAFRLYPLWREASRSAWIQCQVQHPRDIAGILQKTFPSQVYL